MRSRTKTTTWNLFFHFASITLMMVSGVVLVPFYLKFIPLNDYGAWLATGNILIWVTAVDPGLAAVLQQRIGYAYGKKDFQDIRGFICGGLLLAAVFASFPVIAGFLIADNLSGWLNLPPVVDKQMLINAFLLAAIGSGFALLAYSVTAVNQGLLSSVGIGNIYIAVHTLDIVIILFLLHSGWGLMAIAVGFLTRGVGLLLGNLGYLAWRLNSERIGFVFSLKKVASLFKLLSFTFLARTSGLVAGNMESFVIARSLGVALAPVLSLTRKSADISRAFAERPPLAFMPAVSHLAGAGETAKARIILLRLFSIILWLTGLIAGGIFVFNRDFVRLWVGPQFFAGGAINLAICAVAVATIMFSSLSNLCMALGDIKRNNLAILGQSLLYMAIVIVFTKHWGMLGTVLASLVSLTAVSSWYYPRSISKLLRLGREDWTGMGMESMKVTALIIPLAMLFRSVHPPGWGIFIVSILCFICLYGLGLYLFSKSARSEIFNLAHFIHSPGAQAQ